MFSRIRKSEDNGALIYAGNALDNFLAERPANGAYADDVVGLMLSIAATKSRVGAQLARIEGEIAIGTLLRRLPNLRLDDVDHPDWRQTFVLRGLNTLPARW
jgi:hypothetical protein